MTKQSFFKTVALSLVASAILVGCGSSDSTPSSSGGSSAVDVKVVDGYISDGNVTDANGVQATEINGTIGLYRFSSAPTYPIKFTIGKGKLVDTNATFDVNLTAHSGTVLSPITTIVGNDTTIQNNLLTTMVGVNTTTMYADYVDANDTDVAKLAQLCYAMLKDTNATTKFKARLTNGTESNITALIDKAIAEDSNASSNKDGIKNFLTALKNVNGSVKDFERDLNSTKSVVDSYVAGISWKGLIYGTVKSPDTNRTWLDRNLGASEVCTALDDSACYGDYYQWGRNTDGHEKSTSATTATLSTDINNTGTNFITNSSNPYDWASVDSDGALRSSNWSNTDGSSVCPVGYRVPTIDEIKAETTLASTPVTNNTNAFNSFLKLPSAGYRYSSSGSLGLQGSYGRVWSSSPNGPSSQYLQFGISGSAGSYNYNRAYGSSVRCIKAE